MILRIKAQILFKNKFRNVPSLLLNGKVLESVQRDQMFWNICREKVLRLNSRESAVLLKYQTSLHRWCVRSPRSPPALPPSHRSLDCEPAASLLPTGSRPDCKNRNRTGFYHRPEETERPFPPLRYKRSECLLPQTRTMFLRQLWWNHNLNWVPVSYFVGSSTDTGRWAGTRDRSSASRRSLKPGNSVFPPVRTMFW